MKFQGGHVPVWYSPSDHSKVVVDYEADVERIMTGLADMKRMSGESDRRVQRDLEVVFAGSLKDVMRLSLTKHAVKGFQLPS
jgi:hypothetical protein